MRKIIIASLLSVFTLISATIFSTPANAVFCLGKCEKVKKQINLTDSKIAKDIKYINSYIGTSVKIDSVIGESIFNSWNRIDNGLKSNWKLGTNNPNCFTNTQNQFIANKDNWHSFAYTPVYPQGGSLMIYIQSNHWAVGSVI